MASKTENRFRQEDMTGIEEYSEAQNTSLLKGQNTSLLKGQSFVALYKDARQTFKEKSLQTLGYVYELKTSEEKAIKLLNEEIETNLKLKMSWKTAKEGFDPNEDLGHLNSLSDSTKLALRAYTAPCSFYQDFNGECRKMFNFFDWEKFPYKGMFLLLHKAISSKAGHIKPVELYRGINMWTSLSKGSVIKFNQFTSTTSDREIASQIFTGDKIKSSIFIFTNVVTAARLEYLTLVPGEEEYLILPNEGFKVKETKMNGDEIEIYLEPRQQSLLF